VNDDQAIDAALLAFIQREGGRLRERLGDAVAAHLSALTRCRACEGTGKIVVHSNATIWTNDRYRDRPSDQAVPAGQEIPCVSCDGSGCDQERVVWACTAAYHECRPGNRRGEGHGACGWALRLPRDEIPDLSGG
jgi:hypothetical protein